jgi:hypothetical protein
LSVDEINLITRTIDGTRKHVVREWIITASKPS